MSTPLIELKLVDPKLHQTPGENQSDLVMFKKIVVLLPGFKVFPMAKPEFGHASAH